MPCLFLLAALAVLGLPEQLQAISFQTLVAFSMFVQCLAAAGPIATGLVKAVVGLPKLVVQSIDAMTHDFGQKLHRFVRGILGDSPAQMLSSGAIKAIMAICSTALKTAAKVVDVEQFIPGVMMDVSKFATPLGLVLFAAFMLNVFPLMMLLLPYKLGIVWGGTFLIMMGLLSASLFTHKAADIFVFLVEFLVNFAFRTVLGGLLPAESVASALKAVLGADRSPDAETLKSTLLGFCYINPTAPPRTRKRACSQMCSDTAEYVGPKLKRMRTDPGGAARDACSATAAATRSVASETVS